MQEHVYSVAIHLLAIVATDGVIATGRVALFEESLALGRRGGDQWLLSIALNNLGDLFVSEGDYERAVELFEESLAIGEARGDLDRRARALNNLGWATHGLGDLARARDYYRRGLEAATEIGLVEIAAPRAVRHRRVGSRGRRRRHGRSSARPSEGAGIRVSVPPATMRLDALERQTLATLEAALGPERLASELAAGAALSLEDAIDLALGRSDSATPG